MPSHKQTRDTTALMRSVGDQVAEMLVIHKGLTWSVARAETLSLFKQVRISDPGRRMRKRPAGLSSGMLQRVVIAAAIAYRPALIIADEPTTALDASTASEALDLLAEMRRQSGAAMITGTSLRTCHTTDCCCALKGCLAFILGSRPT